MQKRWIHRKIIINTIIEFDNFKWDFQMNRWNRIKCDFVTNDNNNKKEVIENRFDNATWNNIYRASSNHLCENIHGWMVYSKFSIDSKRWKPSDFLDFITEKKKEKSFYVFLCSFSLLHIHFAHDEHEIKFNT